MKVLIIDNYDSFTYNLAFYAKQFPSCQVDVCRNDAITIEEIDKYEKIILSPGPGLPKDSGILKELIQVFSGKKAIFGVCLGMQAIAEVFGSKLINLQTINHGISKKIQIIKKHRLFTHLEPTIQVGLYHSWAVSIKNFSENLEIYAQDEDFNIMMIAHKKHLQTIGVQFHPESILTPSGKQILKNFLFMDNL